MILDVSNILNNTLNNYEYNNSEKIYLNNGDPDSVTNENLVNQKKILLNMINNNNITIKCILTKKLVTAKYFYYKKKRPDEIIYIFDCKFPFLVFYGFAKSSHSRTSLSAIYYYSKNKLFFINDALLNYKKEEIENYCKNYKEILNEKVLIENKKNCLILLSKQNGILMNSTHLIIDDLADFLKLFDKFNCNNTEVYFSEKMNDIYLIEDYCLKNNIKIIEDSSLIKSFPIVLTNIIGKNDYNYIANDNFFKLINFNINNFNYDLSEFDNGKFTIIIVIKLGRRICLNMKKFLMIFLIMLFSKYKDVQVVLSGDYFSEKYLKFNDKGILENFSDLDSFSFLNQIASGKKQNVKSNILKNIEFFNSLCSEISNNKNIDPIIKNNILQNTKSIMGRSIYFIFKVIKLSKFTISNAGSGVADWALFSPNMFTLYFTSLISSDKLFYDTALYYLKTIKSYDSKHEKIFKLCNLNYLDKINRNTIGYSVVKEEATKHLKSTITNFFLPRLDILTNKLLDIIEILKGD